MFAPILVLTLTVPAGAAEFDRQGFRRDVAWLVGAGAVDLLSTEYMLNNCATCYEANPFMQERPALKKALGVGFVVGMLQLLRSKGYGRAADIIRWAAVAFWAGLSARNVWLARH